MKNKLTHLADEKMRKMGWNNFWEKAKIIALVFPPLCSPAILSNGLAYLTAHLKKVRQASQPKFYDLNLEFHDWVLEGKVHPDCESCSRARYCTNKIALSYFNDSFSPEERILNKKIIQDRRFLGSDIYATAIFNLNTIFKTYSYCFNQWCEDVVGGTTQWELQSSFYSLFERIFEGGPNVIGFSVFVHTQLLPALAAAKIAKKGLKAAILLGGAFMPYIEVESVLQNCRYVDFVSVGEGEKCLEALLDSAGYEAIPGICYRGPRGQIGRNENRYVKDLDGIPFPDYSQFELDRYYRAGLILPVLGSRNCSYGRCSFCSHRCNYGPYRERKVEEVCDEIEYLMKRYDTKYFEFRDEEIHPSRYRQIAQEIRKRGLEIHMGGYLRPVKAYREDLIKEMYSAGFRFMIIGLESTSQRVLNLMNKGIDGEYAKQVITWCLETGMICQINLISNFPGCTYDAYLEQAEYFMELSQRFDNFYLAILPFFVAYKSDIYFQPENYFIRDLKPKELLKIKGKRILNFNNVGFQYWLQENRDNTVRFKGLDSTLSKINADRLLTFSREEKIVLKTFLSERKALPSTKIERVDGMIAMLSDMMKV